MAKSKRYVDPQASLDGNNLPLSSYGSIDSKYLPNYKANNKDSQVSIGDTGSANYLGNRYERSPYDDSNTYEEDIPYLNDIRTENQGFWSSIGNSTGKFIGKTALNIVGGVAGTVYGAGLAITDKDISKLWDNSFTEKVDEIDKGLDDIFKVYKSSDYLDQNILQRAFLHPLQFIDDTTDALSFTAGAILTELGTAGIASEVMIPKAIKYMKYLSEGAEAAEATKNLTSLGRGILNGTGDFGRVTRQLATGASYESIVEARQATMQLRDKMYSDYAKENPGREMPESVKSDIDDRLSKAGLFTYLSNLALVGSTNMVEFPKIFGLGYKTSKVAAGSIERDAETGLFNSAKKSFKDLSTLDKAKVLLKNPFQEGIKEEGLQNVISGTNRQFFDRKNDDDSKNIVSKYLSDAADNLANTYTSKEGWNDIGMGMIIGALGAPGRGVLSILGEDNPIGRYGFDKVYNEKGEVIGTKKAAMWTGGIKGSIDEHNAEVEHIQSVVDDLNKHTNLFKSMKANHDFLVESQSLQKEKETALDAGDVFNFQNAKDDQIHAYTASRIKSGMYDDLLDTLDDMKKLSPDEFYIQFRGEEAAAKVSNIEKTRFQQDSIQEFADKAKNTRDAYNIVDDVYKGDNENIREELAHSIAASKNLDYRENSINQSLADLSNGFISNYSLRGNNDSYIKGNIDFIKDQLKQENLSEENIRDLNTKLIDNTRALQIPELAALISLKESNPTAYTLNGDKIVELLSDSKKLREKRQNYLDLYNHLFTEEGQTQFQKHLDDLAEIQRKQEEVKIKEEEDKAIEKEKKSNIKETVDKAKTIESGDLPNVVFDETEEDEINLEEAEGEAIETTEKNSIHAQEKEVLEPEEVSVVKIEEHKELTTNKSVILSEDNLVRNSIIEPSKWLGELTIINADRRRSLGNTIAYLGQNKITLNQLDKEGNVVQKTYNTFNDDGSVEINENVDTKLFSQNYYKVGDKITLNIPTFEEMQERGLDSYTEINYLDDINDIAEFPIAIRNQSNEIIGYLPTQSGIERLVSEEFKEQALASNLTLRENIFENKEAQSSITSKSPGFLLLDHPDSQKSLFDSLGNGSNKLADKVKLGIVKLGELYINNSARGRFADGDIVNPAEEEGVVYAIVPSSETNKYITYPMKVNTIGEDKARTVVEAIRLFANKDNLSETDKQSLENITEFNFNNFGDVIKFINKITYTSAKAGASEFTAFRLFKDYLYLSSLSDQKFSLQDIVNNPTTRDEIVSILANRYYSVELSKLNSNRAYTSYSLDGSVIIENEHPNYQSYLNDNKVITSNIRGINIEDNEFAFTTQPVIGISDNITKEVKQLPAVVEEVVEEPERAVESPKLTKKTLFDPKKVKPLPLDDINPEFIESQTIKSGEDLRRKCL